MNKIVVNNKNSADNSIVLDTAKGWKREGKPKIKNTLIILDPITFPKIISWLFPFLITEILAINSGNEVPIANKIADKRSTAIPKDFES